MHPHSNPKKTLNKNLQFVSATVFRGVSLDWCIQARAQEPNPSIFRKGFFIFDY